MVSTESWRMSGILRKERKIGPSSVDCQNDDEEEEEQEENHVPKIFLREVG